MKTGGFIRKEKKSSIVYSTNPDFDKNIDEEIDLDHDNTQDLRIHLIRKGGGKIVTVVRGYKGSIESLKSLGKYLQSSCSTGGTFNKMKYHCKETFVKK